MNKHMRYTIYRVFAKNKSEGNPTAIAYCDNVLPKDQLQQLARDLSVPDTIFIFNDNDPDILFSSLSFSPFTELSICGQALVGSIFSLIGDGKITKDSYMVKTAKGISKVIVEKEGSCTEVYVSLGIPKVTNAHLVNLELLKLEGSFTKSIINKSFIELGRKRLIIEIPLDLLKSINVSSSDVMQFCHSYDITGIVFFSYDTSKANCIRSRHFTTSLNGEEDAVTGGASGTILAYCSHHKGDTNLLVHQGGFQTQQGYIATKYNQQENVIYIGGQAIKINEGMIDLKGGLPKHDELH